MKRTKITDSEKLAILRLFSQMPRPSQEEVAEETHHRKTKIGSILKEFQSLDWDKAKAFCGNDPNILRLRDDCFERKIEEERDQEETLKDLQNNLRHELGSLSFNTYMKDGVWINEF